MGSISEIHIQTHCQNPFIYIKSQVRENSKSEILCSHSLYVRKYSTCEKDQKLCPEAVGSQEDRKTGSFVFASIAPSKWSYQSISTVCVPTC